MKSFFAPVLLLAGLLLASTLNCRTMVGYTDQWRTQLDLADTLAAEENWSGARSALSDSYASWSQHQTYLHIVAEHEAVDGAESMYRRAASFAQSEESSEFQAEIADLQDHLRLLAEMERFSIKNIL